MELKDYIQDAIKTFYGLISDKEEGAKIRAIALGNGVTRLFWKKD